MNLNDWLNEYNLCRVQRDEISQFHMKFAGKTMCNLVKNKN